jgi:uncharacterized membrane protein HdeD (DUF308 family)
MAELGKGELLQSAWTGVLLRGIASLVFGILALINPGLTIGVLVMIFGIYSIIDGLVALWAGITNNSPGRNRGLTILHGIVGILAGLFCLIWPALAALYFVILIGLWYIVTGVVELVEAIALRKEIDNEIWLGLAGLASIVLGAAIIFFPKAGALSILWLIAVLAIIAGVSLIMLAFRLRGLGKKLAT